jgi:hypothetical protein
LVLAFALVMTKRDRKVRDGLLGGKTWIKSRTFDHKRDDTTLRRQASAASESRTISALAIRRKGIVRPIRTTFRRF